MSIMATFSGDVQYTQNGTLTNPWSNCHKLSTSVTMRHKSWGPWSRSNSATLEVLLVDGFPVVGFFRGVHTCNESFHSAVHMEEPEQLSVLSVLSVTCCQTTMPRCVVSHRSASSVAVCGRLWPSVALDDVGHGLVAATRDVDRWFHPAETMRCATKKCWNS